MSIPLPRSAPRWPRPSRLLVLEGALIALLLVQAAPIATMLPLAAPSLPDALPATPPAARAPSLASWGDPFHRQEAAGDAAGGYRLFGIRLAGTGSVAYLGHDGLQRAYRIGDEVAPGLALAAVATDHVVLRGAGGNARLTLPRPGTAGTDTAP